MLKGGNDMNDVRIQDDLFDAMNGEWLKSAVIPDDKPTTGGFALLVEDVEKTLMADFDAFLKGKKTTDLPELQDAIKLYGKVLDVERRNRDGIQPVLPLLNTIKNIKSVEELNQQAKELMLWNCDLPINFGVQADMKDATSHSFIVLGPSIILPDTTYYGTKTGDQLLEVYKTMAMKALEETDLSKEEREQYLADTIAYDALISKKVKSQLEWADYVNNYNPMSLEEVCKAVAPFDLKGLLEQIYDHLPETIVVFDPKAIKEMNGYFNEENLALYIHHTYVNSLLSASKYLSEQLANNATTFRRALTGVASDPTLEKQAFLMASNTYSGAVGVYYGRTYFGEEAKKDIVSLVEKIIETYKKRMSKNTFLKEETKQKAILKLSTIAIKMGYPDKIDPFYATLKINDEASYYANMLEIQKAKILKNLNKLYIKVDKQEWQMPGHMVNACYDPSRNDITFPAAILQKPFYSIEQTVSENLGGIGAVIGHEISHAFDNNGAHFDENGNLANWWSEEDFAAFKELTNQMIEQWDGIEYYGGKVNGELVVSENIADNGGMAVTLEIMHDLENTSFEEYFKNWGKIWCMKGRKEYILYLLNNDVHSPAKLRSNIPPRNFKEWYETFDVKETDQMYIDPEKRIHIW